MLYGQVAESVYAADLKSVGLNSLEGSSPSLPTTKKRPALVGRFFVAMFSLKPVGAQSNDAKIG